MNMTEENIESLRQLKEFINDFGLRNQNGIIHFDASVKIKMTSNQGDFSCDVRVHFNHYNRMGTLQLNSNGLDPEKFPTQYIVDFNKFEFKDSMYLQITGKHPVHGSYTTQITNALIISD